MAAAGFDRHHPPGVAGRVRVGSGDFSAFDDDGFLRNVLMEAFIARGYEADFVDDLGAFGDFAEYGIAPAVAGGGLEVEEAIVGHIDEELGSGRMRVVGARHGDGVAGVLEAVVGFVLDRCVAGFLLHVGGETAALNHEAVDHAMEDGVVVVAGLDIGNEILDSFRGFFGVEFEGDEAEVGMQLDHLKSLDDVVVV
jgi:hypothetical protein